MRRPIQFTNLASPLSACRLEQLERRLLMFHAADLEPYDLSFLDSEPLLETPTNDPLPAGDTTADAPSPWNLSSLPGALATLYLDFDGSPARTWASHEVPETPAYDTDGRSDSFSSRELSNLVEIWKRVSEKFSPFNINVTTLRPDRFADQQALEVVIGGDSAWWGQAIGGVAQRGSFSNAAENTVWVFSENLGDGYPKYVAEIVAHEAGHAFGLSHQSDYDEDGQLVREYARGDSNAGPIMGSSFYSRRGLWSNANGADELAVLAGSRNGFGYRKDDHGNALSTATTLIADDTFVASGGVIHNRDDQDWFEFSTGAGTIEFTADVAEFGSMLDLRIGLHDSTGNLVTGIDLSARSETLTTEVAAGMYFISIESHGGYGDIGTYVLSGTLPAETDPPDVPTVPTSQNRSTKGLVIGGTDQDDDIRISVEPAARRLLVNVNGKATSYPMADLVDLQVVAGAGNDRVEIDASVRLDIRIYGEAGDDHLIGGLGDDRLFGGDGNDVLIGGNGSDRLRGGAGNDSLHGTSGNDSLWGHSGDDILFGGDGDDLLRGGEGQDVLKGSAGSDILLGHDGDDDLFGAEGNDLIRGHAGHDRLFSGSGDDALDGGAGDDELEASQGANVLLGGGGGDTFVGRASANLFADYDATRDWLAPTLTDLRTGMVDRHRDQPDVFYTSSHPAYPRLVAAFAYGPSDVSELRIVYGQVAA